MKISGIHSTFVSFYDTATYQTLLFASIPLHTGRAVDRMTGKRNINNIQVIIIEVKHCCIFVTEEPHHANRLFLISS